MGANQFEGRLFHWRNEFFSKGILPSVLRTQIPNWKQEFHKWFVRRTSAFLPGTFLYPAALNLLRTRTK